MAGKREVLGNPAGTATSVTRPRDQQMKMDGWMDGWLDGWMDGWMDGVFGS